MDRLITLLAAICAWPHGTGVGANVIASVLLGLPAFLHLHIKLNRHQRELAAALLGQVFEATVAAAPRRKNLRSIVGIFRTPGRRVGRHKRPGRLNDGVTAKSRPPSGGAAHTVDNPRA